MDTDLIRNRVQQQILKEHEGQDLSVTAEYNDKGEVYFYYPVDKYEWLMAQATESRIRAGG